MEGNGEEKNTFVYRLKAILVAHDGLGFFISRVIGRLSRPVGVVAAAICICREWTKPGTKKTGNSKVFSFFSEISPNYWFGIFGILRR